MPALPTGTVTFLFSDLEGSTRLWEEREEVMPDALARHEALAAEIFTRHAGVLVKSRGEGDSCFAVFDEASDAILAACAFQQALISEPWPVGVALRARIALHTGDAEPIGGDYLGPPVNRCARLRGVAHGGQIVLSEATAQLVRDTLPAPFSLVDLREHRLRDLTRPERIYQLTHPSLPADFPPLVTQDVPVHNLPQPLTSFVGRAREKADVQRLLPQNRLLTLIGTGGSGKTRLALSVASEQTGDYEGGVCLVELAALSNPALVPQAVATALNIREAAGQSLTDTLRNTLREKARLLVLDNCEHLLDACARLTNTLLGGCPRLRVLATSRQALGIAGECVYPVPPLMPPLPASARAPLAPNALAQNDAVRLFMERAALSQPHFALTAHNAPHVAGICRQLDGLPLGIELAAAWVKMLSPEQIARRLQDRFRLLTGGSRTAAPRQQTMQAALDWSYDLLSDSERSLFGRVSVFAGGWTLDAAEAVCAGDGPDGTHIEEWDVLDLLASLVEKSLVVADDVDGQKRCRLLETLRQYSEDRQRETGSPDAMRARHCNFFLALAERAEPELRGANQAEWLNTLEREHDNFRVVLGDSDSQHCLRLGIALHRFWYARGYISEGRGWLAGALSETGDAALPLRAKGLNALGVLAWAQADYAAACACHQEALALFHQQQDSAGIARTLMNLGIVSDYQQEYEQASAFYDESISIFRARGDMKSVAHVLNNRGAHFIHRSEPAAAIPFLQESLAIRQTLSDQAGIASVLYDLGMVACEQQQWPEARASLREALRIRHALGDLRNIAFVLLYLAWVEQALGSGLRAARLLGATETAYEQAKAPKHPNEHDTQKRIAAALGDEIGEEYYALLCNEGKTMTTQQAVAYALELPAGETGDDDNAPH